MHPQRGSVAVELFSLVILPFSFSPTFTFSFLLNILYCCFEQRETERKKPGFMFSTLCFFRSSGQEEDKRVLQPAVSETSVTSAICVWTRNSGFSSLNFLSVTWEKQQVSVKSWAAPSSSCDVSDSRVSELWHYCCFGLANCLLWVRLSVLCTEGCLAASLDSTDYIPVALPSCHNKKCLQAFPDTNLGDEIAAGWEPLTEDKV